MIRNRFINILMFLCLLIFWILFNILNIKKTNYPLSEWLQYQFINLKSYYKDGETIRFPLNIRSLEENEINKSIFINGWFMLNKDNNLYPFSLAWSSYIFSHVTELTETRNINSYAFILGLIWLIYFYLSIKLLTGRILILILWSLFYWFTYVIFQYYLSISDSSIWLILFIASYYYFLKCYILNKNDIKYLFIGTLLFSTTVIVRIDYILMSPLILLLIIPILIKDINKKLIIIGILIWLIFWTLFISNFYRHWNYLSLWYEKEKSNIEYLGNVEKRNKIEILFKRFFSNLDNIEKSKERIIHNQKFFLNTLNISYLFFVFFLIGIVASWKYPISKKILILQLIYIWVVYTYVSSMYFTDSGTEWIMSVHTRYLLPVYYIIFLYSLGIGLLNFIKKIHNFKIIIIFWFLIFQILLFFWNFGKWMWINDLARRKEEARIFYSEIEYLKENDFLFSFLDKSGSINQSEEWPYVIHIPYINGQWVFHPEIIKAIDYLIKINKPVYIYLTTLRDPELKSLYQELELRFKIIKIGWNIYNITSK